MCVSPVLSTTNLIQMRHGTKGRDRPTSSLVSWILHLITMLQWVPLPWAGLCLCLSDRKPDWLPWMRILRTGCWHVVYRPVLSPFTPCFSAHTSEDSSSSMAPGDVLWHGGDEGKGGLPNGSRDELREVSKGGCRKTERERERTRERERDRMCYCVTIWIPMDRKSRKLCPHVMSCIPYSHGGHFTWMSCSGWDQRVPRCKWYKQIVGISKASSSVCVQHVLWHFLLRYNIKQSCWLASVMLAVV